MSSGNTSSGTDPKAGENPKTQDPNLMSIRTYLSICGLAAIPAGAHAQLTYTTGLDVWLDASDVDGSGNSTLGDGDPVTTWVNKGTTGVNDAGPPAAGTANNPGTLVVEGGEGVQDAVTLENTRFQFGQEWADSADVTIYLVVYQGPTSSANGTLLTDYGDVTQQLRTLRAAGGSAGAYLRDAESDTIVVGHGAEALAGEKWAVLFYSFDSSTGTSTWGELGSTLTGTNPDFDATTTFEGPSGGPVTLFGFHDGNNSHDFNGLVSEVLIYDHLLDESQRGEVEAYLVAKASVPDVDSDGISDGYELANTDPPSDTALVPAEDDDGDGLTNLQEHLGLDAFDSDHGFGSTRAILADSDSDGIGDNDELTGALNPYKEGQFEGDPPEGVPGAPTDPNDADSDDDGLLDGEEVLEGSDGFVTNPWSVDTDADFMSDAYEVANNLLGGLDPTDPSDSDFGADLDGDGIDNYDEFFAGTRADKADTDEDGLGDGVENGSGVWEGAGATGTDPLHPDSDGDGLMDGEENPDLADHNPPSQNKADPNAFDSDGDSYGDGDEVTGGSDPSDNTSVPAPAPGIALRIDFHRAGDAGQEVQTGWGVWEVDKDANDVSISKTIGAMSVTATAGGTGYITSRGPSDDRAGEITGTPWDNVVEELVVVRGGDGSATLDFTGLDPAATYELTLFHNDPYTVAGNAGFAGGDGIVTPSVTVGTVDGAAHPGMNTNVRPGESSEGEFVNSVVRFTPDASGNATIQLASTTEFVVLNGFSLASGPGSAGEMSITRIAFNLQAEVELTVTGMDPAKTYVLKRSADLVDGFPFTAFGPFSPASDTEVVIDAAPLPGRAFYIIEETP